MSAINRAAVFGVVGFCFLFSFVAPVYGESESECVAYKRNYDEAIAQKKTPPAPAICDEATPVGPVRGHCVVGTSVCRGEKTAEGKDPSKPDVQVDTSKNSPTNNPDSLTPYFSPTGQEPKQTQPATGWQQSVQGSLLESALNPPTPSEDVWKSPSADSFDRLIQQLQSDSGASPQDSGTGLSDTLRRWGASVFGDGNSQTMTPVDADGQAFGDPVQVQTFNPSEGTPGSTFAQPGSQDQTAQSSGCDSWYCNVGKQFQEYGEKIYSSLTGEQKPSVSCGGDIICSAQQAMGLRGTTEQMFQAEKPVFERLGNDELQSGEGREICGRDVCSNQFTKAQLEDLKGSIIKDVRASTYPQREGTAYGGVNDPNQFTLASKEFPNGARVLQYNPATGDTVVARVNDTGPFIEQSNGVIRGLDNTPAVMNSLRMSGLGNPDIAYMGQEGQTGYIGRYDSMDDAIAAYASRNNIADITPVNAGSTAIASAGTSATNPWGNNTSPVAYGAANMQYAAYTPSSSFSTGSESAVMQTASDFSGGWASSYSPTPEPYADFSTSGDTGIAVDTGSQTSVSNTSVSNQVSEPIGSALDQQNVDLNNYLASQERIRNVSNDSVTATLDHQEYAASLYDQERALASDVQKRLDSLNVEPFNQESIDAFNKSQEVDLSNYVNTQLRSLDDQTTATDALDQQEEDWSLYQQTKADNKELADFTQLQLNALGSPESLTAALDRQEMFDEQSREQFIESEIVKVAGAQEPIPLSKIEDDIRLANVKDGIYQFSNHGDLRGEFLVNPVTAALIPDSMKAKLQAASENRDATVSFTKQELDSIRWELMSGSQKTGLENLLKQGGYEYTGSDITRPAGAEDVGNLSRLAEERQNWANGNYVVKSSDFGSQDAGINEASGAIDTTAKTPAPVVADASKDIPLSDGPPIPVEGGNERLHVLSDAQVDEKVRMAFDAKTKDAQATVRYAQDLLARSESPTARLAAQTGIDEAQRRLEAVEEASAAYKAGNPSPELQKVIERIRTGDDAGLFSQGLSALSERAHSDAKKIGENIQTSVDITKPSALWEIPKMVWDGGAWAVASGVGMVADSGRNLLEKLDVVGFRADTDRALSAAIDPIGSEWKTVADVAVIAPFGTGLAKSAVGVGVDTAFDVGAAATRNVFGKVADEAGLLVRDSAGFATTLERDAVARAAGDAVVVRETQLPGVRISQGTDDFAETVPRNVANENVELRDAIAARLGAESVPAAADAEAIAAAAPRGITNQGLQNLERDLGRAVDDINAAPRVEPTAGEGGRVVRLADEPQMAEPRPAGEVAPAPKTPADVVPEVPTTPAAEKPWYQRAYDRVFGENETPAVVPEREKIVRLADEPQIEAPTVREEAPTTRAIVPEEVPNPKVPAENFDYAKAPTGIEPNIRVNPKMPEDPVFVRIENPNQGKVVSSSSDLEALKNARGADGSIQGYVSKGDYDALVAMRSDVRGIPEHISITPVRVGAEIPPAGMGPSWLKNPVDWVLKNPKKAAVGATGVGAASVFGFGITHRPTPPGGKTPPPPPSDSSSTGGKPPAKPIAPPKEEKQDVPPPGGGTPQPDNSNTPSPTGRQNGGGIGGMLSSLMGALSNLFKGSQSPQTTPATPAVRPPVTPPNATSTVPKPFATLIANPATILSGKTSRLIWSSINTSSCELFAPDNLSMATGIRGSTSTLALATTTRFTLNCSAPSGATTSSQTTVTVQ